jgi:site-specific DNA-methyltransferase (cytosine-N4-specific)
MPEGKSAQRTLCGSHRTACGTFYVGKIEESLDSPELRQHAGKVQLILTSPPFPLNHKKSYGNLTGAEYLRWLEDLAPAFSEMLTGDGSIVIELGNAWERHRPVQSLLPTEALLAFVKSPKAGLRLIQQFVCYNPSRLPTPAQWVTVERIRAVDSFTHVWWMSKSDFPKADNRRVLRPYSDDMKALLQRRTYNSGRRPSEHVIRQYSFLADNGGSIAHNLFELESLDVERPVRLPNAFSFGSSGTSKDFFSRACRERGVTPHPARMPMGLAAFFIEFLSEPGDMVLDPFAGSNTTGYVAARLGRRWISVDAEEKYVQMSQIRFEDPALSESERSGCAVQKA